MESSILICLESILRRVVEKLKGSLAYIGVYAEQWRKLLPYYNNLEQTIFQMERSGEEKVSSVL